MRCSRHLIQHFREVRLKGVPCENNSDVDALAKLGSQEEAVLLGMIPLEIQEAPNIREMEVMDVDNTPLLG